MRRPLTPFAAAAFAAFAASCGADADQDGFTEADGDCDDRNDTVFPDARERSGDGVDADCDGKDDPRLGKDRYADALPLLDQDQDGAISLEEFDAACAESAMVFGEANPGVLQTHAACGGTAGGRGMILHPWNQLFEHDCRGVNTCSGWSCVETADDRGRSGAEVFTAARCDWCHTGSDGAFLVHVPEGEDPTDWVDGFLDLPDDRFRAVIAFGASGVGADGVAYANMPPHHETLSRAEMDAVIDHLRQRPLEAADDGSE